MTPTHNIQPHGRDSEGSDSDGDLVPVAVGSNLRVGELRVRFDNVEGDMAEVNIVTDQEAPNNETDNDTILVEAPIVTHHHHIESVEVISGPDENGVYPDNLVVAYNAQNENGEQYVQYEHYEVINNLEDYPELQHLINAEGGEHEADDDNPVLFDLIMQPLPFLNAQQQDGEAEEEVLEEEALEEEAPEELVYEGSDNEDIDEHFYDGNEENSDDYREDSDEFREYDDEEEEEERRRGYTDEFRDYLAEYESITPRNEQVNTSEEEDEEDEDAEFDPYQTAQFDRFLPTLGLKCDVYTVISIVLNVMLLVAATIFIPMGINRLTQNGCDGNLNVNGIFQQIDDQGMILNQNVPLGHLQYALRSAANFNAIALTGPHGVGKSMFVEVLQDNFPWPLNMRSYSWNTDVSDDNVKLDVIRLMVKHMSKCGINLLVIRNLGPCHYDTIMRIKTMVQDTKHIDTKRVLLVFVVNVPVSETKKYCNMHLQNMKSSSNISFITFNTFGEQELQDCIWQESRLRKLDLDDKEVKKIARSINVYKTGCHEKRFPADNFAEWNNGHPLGLRTVHAYVLVYDMGNLETFQYCRAMREQILDSFSHRDFSIIVVGNKYDTISTEAQANSQELKDISTLVRKHWRCGYVECSAQFNYKIGDVFRELMGCTSTGSAVGTEYTQSNRNKGRCTIL